MDKGEKEEKRTFEGTNGSILIVTSGLIFVETNAKNPSGTTGIVFQETLNLTRIPVRLLLIDLGAEGNGRMEDC